MSLDDFDSDFEEFGSSSSSLSMMVIDWGSVFFSEAAFLTEVDEVLQTSLRLGEWILLYFDFS